jgi:hypothetical protein
VKPVTVTTKANDCEKSADWHSFLTLLVRHIKRKKDFFFVVSQNFDIFAALI